MKIDDSNLKSTSKWVPERRAHERWFPESISRKYKLSIYDDKKIHRFYKQQWLSSKYRSIGIPWKNMLHHVARRYKVKYKFGDNPFQYKYPVYFDFSDPDDKTVECELDDKRLIIHNITGIDDQIAITKLGKLIYEHLLKGIDPWWYSDKCIPFKGIMVYAGGINSKTGEMLQAVRCIRLVPPYRITR